MRDLNFVPLSALRAVEAVARLGGLRAAASEIGVSDGAVSQAVLKVEARLGRPLFERRPRGMVPTELGAEVCADLTDGMGRIARAVRRARSDTADLLTVSVAPVFASRWLVPRLGRFHGAHPSVRLRVDASLGFIDPNASDIDACIRSGRGGWPGVSSRRLCDQSVFPVCAPALAPRPGSVDDLSDVPILRDESDPDLWSLWLDARGLGKDALGGGTTFSDAGLCMDAAMAGQGVYLAVDALVRDALAAGLLVRPFEANVRIDRAYWLVTPEAGRPKAAVRDFAAWLDRELAPA